MTAQQPLEWIDRHAEAMPQALRIGALYLVDSLAKLTEGLDVKWRISGYQRALRVSTLCAEPLPVRAVELRELEVEVCSTSQPDRSFVALLSVDSDGDLVVSWDNGWHEACGHGGIDNMVRSMAECGYFRNWKRLDAPKAVAGQSARYALYGGGGAAEDGPVIRDRHGDRLIEMPGRELLPERLRAELDAPGGPVVLTAEDIREVYASLLEERRSLLREVNRLRIRVKEHKAHAEAMRRRAAHIEQRAEMAGLWKEGE